MLRSNLVPYADLRRHTEITLQDVPNREYNLRLFVENEERGLEKTGNRSWTPAQRQYALCFVTTYTHREFCVSRDVSSLSEMHVEIEMRSGHAFWAKNRQNADVIDIQGLLEEYWDSNEQDFLIPSQLRPPTRLPISDNGTQGPLLLGSTMGV